VLNIAAIATVATLSVIVYRSISTEEQSFAFDPD
jgi:hypothetical protein